VRTSEKKIRVMVADDSAFMRRVLREIISSDPQMEVVGEARDGREAVALAGTLQPDVVTMDIKMPHLDGLGAIELIMSQNPRPIVIVSSESREGAASTLRGLELGAIDFVPKPTSGVDLDMNNVRDDLTRKLRLAAKVRVVRTATRSAVPSPAAAPAHRREPLTRPSSLPSGGNGHFPIVVLAASTGGPSTLMRLVPRFGKDFPGAVIAVLHMPATFTGQFSLQLAENAALRVKEAESSEALQPGTLYICPGSHHLRITPFGRIALDDGPRISGYRPCADVTMETVAAYAGAMTVGVVLTGMGNDGSRGVQAVKKANGMVIAEAESTAVIFGMPAEAIKTGAVDHILPLDEIYSAIEKRALKLSRLAPVTVR
jgi:two-component system, chemotaxis family, protein-glutamate methylesterase/glutaminase